MDPTIAYSNYPQNPTYNQPILNAPQHTPVARKVTPGRKAVGGGAAVVSNQALPLQQRNSISGASLSSQPGSIAQPALATHRASVSSFSSASSNIAANTALPPGWEVLYTPDGKPYYSNHITKATTWTRPEVTPSPIPAGWEERKTPDGKVYYCHLPTQKTQWERPSAPSVQQEKIPVTPAQSIVYPSNTTLAQPVVDALPPGWEERKTAEGKVYYCNVPAQTTQWNRPKATPQPQQTRGVSNPLVNATQSQQMTATLAAQRRLSTIPNQPAQVSGQPQVHNAHVTPRPLVHAQTTTGVPTRNTIQQNIVGQPQLAPISTSTQNALPPGWEERRTKEGKVYYCNVPAQVTQWERPPMPTQPLFTTQKQVVSPQPGYVNPQVVNHGQSSQQVAVHPGQAAQVQQFSTQRQVASPQVDRSLPQVVAQQPQAFNQQNQQFSTQKQVVNPGVAQSLLQASRSIQPTTPTTLNTRPQMPTNSPGLIPVNSEQHTNAMQQPPAPVAIPNVQATKIVQPIGTSSTVQSPIVSPLSAQPQQVQSAPVALWEVRQTVEGDPYFFNTQTKVCAWELPPQSSGYFAVIPQAHLVPPHLIAQENAVQTPQGHIASPAQPQSTPVLDATTLPAGWEERRTAEGRAYFCNVSAQTTQWDHPLKLTQTTTQTSTTSSAGTTPADLKNSKRKSTFGLGALTSSKTMQKMKMPTSAKAMGESSMKGLKSAGKYVKNNKGKVLGVAAGAGLASVLLKETLGIDFDLGEDGGDDLGGGGGEDFVATEEAPAEQPPVEQQTYYEQTPVEQPVYEPMPYEQPVYEQPVYEQPVYEQPVYEPVQYEQVVYEPAPFEQAYEPAQFEQTYEPVPYEQQAFESVPIEEQVYEPQQYEEAVVLEEPLPQEEVVPTEEAPPVEEAPPQEEAVPAEEVASVEQAQPVEEEVVQQEQPQEEVAQDHPPQQEPPPQESVIAEEQHPQEEQVAQDSDAQSEAESAAEEEAERQEEAAEEAAEQEDEAVKEAAEQQSEAESDAESAAEDLEERQQEAQEEHEETHKKKNKSTIEKLLAVVGAGSGGEQVVGGAANDQAAYITSGENVDYSNDLDALHAQQMIEAQGSQNAMALI